MKILVLGGSVFLGRAIAEAAVRRGHDVTTFNRGVTYPVSIPGAKHIRGDRYRDIACLRGFECDLVFDTSGCEAEVVQSTLDVLASSIAHYTFFSTDSVYADQGHEGNNESSPTLAPHEPGDAKDDPFYFATAKLACERELIRRIPDRTLVVRCGLLIGCKDRTERFSYWVRRIRRGGQVLAPDGRNQAIQLIDVEDVAEWALEKAEAHQTGIFNVVGPQHQATLGWLLETCVQTIGGRAELVWVPERALVGLGVRPSIDLPLWVPRPDGSLEGYFKIDTSKAVSCGLRLRPLSATIETLLSREPLPNLKKQWLDPVREAEAIGAWRHAARRQA